MVSNEKSSCPNCGGRLFYYDSVTRSVTHEHRRTTQIKIKRLRCMTCGKVHRCLPDTIYPYIQYRSDIVQTILWNGQIDTPLDLEDYPCDTTVQRWRAKFATPIMEVNP